MFDVTELVGHWGYLAVFVIVGVGNVGVPVPEETALLAAGYLVWRGDLRWSLVLMVGIVSAVAGDNVGYWIGQRYGPGVLERFRRLIGISPPRFQSMRSFIVRWGSLGVFMARFLAGLRFLAGSLSGGRGAPLLRLHDRQRARSPPSSGCLCAGGFDWPHDVQLPSSISVPRLGLPSERAHEKMDNSDGYTAMPRGLELLCS